MLAESPPNSERPLVYGPHFWRVIYHESGSLSGRIQWQHPAYTPEQNLGLAINNIRGILFENVPWLLREQPFDEYGQILPERRDEVKKVITEVFLAQPKGIEMFQQLFRRSSPAGEVTYTKRMVFNLAFADWGLDFRYKDMPQGIRYRLKEETPSAALSLMRELLIESVPEFANLLEPDGRVDRSNKEKHQKALNILLKNTKMSVFCQTFSTKMCKFFFGSGVMAIQALAEDLGVDLPIKELKIPWKMIPREKVKALLQAEALQEDPEIQDLIDDETKRELLIRKCLKVSTSSRHFTYVPLYLYGQKRNINLVRELVFNEWLGAVDWHSEVEKYNTDRLMVFSNTMNRVFVSPYRDLFTTINNLRPLTDSEKIAYLKTPKGDITREEWFVEIYEQWWREHYAGQAIRYAAGRVFELANRESSKALKVIDAGSGPLMLARTLGVRENIDITTIHYSSRMLEVGRQQYKEETGQEGKGIVSSIAAMPIPKASADIIVSSLTFDSLDSPETQSKSLERVNSGLAEQGRFILTVPYSFMTNDRLILLEEQFLKFGFVIDSQYTGAVESLDNPQVPFTGYVLEAVKLEESKKGAILSENFFSRIPKNRNGKSNGQVEVEKSDRTIIHNKFILTPVRKAPSAVIVQTPQEEQVLEEIREDISNLTGEEIAKRLSGTGGKWVLVREAFGSEERYVLVKSS